MELIECMTAHAVTDAQVLRDRGDVAVEHLRIRAVRVLVEEVMLDRSERMEAHPVAELHLLDGVLVRLIFLWGVQGLGTGIS